MTNSNVSRGVCALLAASLLSLPAIAQPGVASAPECDGDKSGKEVKKPNGDDKRPTNPSGAEFLCDGDKGKEVKKPNGDDKRPTNPS